MTFKTADLVNSNQVHKTGPVLKYNLPPLMYFFISSCVDFTFQIAEKSMYFNVNLLCYRSRLSFPTHCLSSVQVSLGSNFSLFLFFKKIHKSKGKVSKYLSC